MVPGSHAQATDSTTLATIASPTSRTWLRANHSTHR